MTTYVALLRAVNVAANNPLRMRDLAAWLGGLGFANVRTVLQTGNAIFTTRARPTATLERKLEVHAAADLRLTTSFFVMTADEWRAAVARNPFTQEAARDPARLVAVVMKAAPGHERVATLRAAIVGRERVHGEGRVLYAVYPDGQGRSTLTGALIARHLGTPGTARNWNTVLKLAAALTD
ncbi:MAG TPA: DUF1697 domain-containing protein [Vicinamibacterales bacterium]|nr:DUF1697 domain-containing protein [Vicinamibacterales bacterium]